MPVGAVYSRLRVVKLHSAESAAALLDIQHARDNPFWTTSRWQAVQLTAMRAVSNMAYDQDNMYSRPCCIPSIPEISTACTIIHMKCIQSAHLTQPVIATEVDISACVFFHGFKFAVSALSFCNENLGLFQNPSAPKHYSGSNGRP